MRHRIHHRGPCVTGNKGHVARQVRIFIPSDFSPPIFLPKKREER